MRACVCVCAVCADPNVCEWRAWVFLVDVLAFLRPNVCVARDRRTHTRTRRHRCQQTDIGIAKAILSAWHPESKRRCECRNETKTCAVHTTARKTVCKQNTVKNHYCWLLTVFGLHELSNRTLTGSVSLCDCGRMCCCCCCYRHGMVLVEAREICTRANMRDGIRSTLPLVRSFFIFPLVSFVRHWLRRLAGVRYSTHSTHCATQCSRKYFICSFNSDLLHSCVLCVRSSPIHSVCVHCVHSEAKMCAECAKHMSVYVICYCGRRCYTQTHWRARSYFFPYDSCQPDDASTFNAYASTTEPTQLTE